MDQNDSHNSSIGLSVHIEAYINNGENINVSENLENINLSAIHDYLEGGKNVANSSSINVGSVCNVANSVIVESGENVANSSPITVENVCNVANSSFVCVGRSKTDRNLKRKAPNYVDEKNSDDDLSEDDVHSLYLSGSDGENQLSDEEGNPYVPKKKIRT